MFVRNSLNTGEHSVDLNAQALLPTAEVVFDQND